MQQQKQCRGIFLATVGIFWSDKKIKICHDVIMKVNHKHFFVKIFSLSIDYSPIRVLGGLVERDNPDDLMFLAKGRSLRSVQLRHTVPRSTPLHCTALNWAELYCAVQHYIQLQCTALHFMYGNVLNCAAMQFTNTTSYRCPLLHRSSHE